MGCQESSCRTRETLEEEAEEFLTDGVKRSDPADGGVCDPPAASRHVLDFAQRMSEDVVAQALQLCWLVEERYKELPFIDSERDYVI